MFSRSGEGDEDELMTLFQDGRLRFLRGRRETKSATVSVILAKDEGRPGQGFHL